MAAGEPRRDADGTGRAMMKGCAWQCAVGLSLITAISSSARSARAATVVEHEVQSAAVARNTMGISSLRRVRVLIPDGYAQSRERYPVFYFLPPFGGTGEGIIAGLSRLAGERAVEQAITVIPDLRERIVPLNSEKFGSWEDFIVRELVPFIDETYRTVPEPRGRAILGASTGGIGALLIPLRHPGVWSAIGLNDPSTYYTGYYELHAGDAGRALPVALADDIKAVMAAWRTMPSSLERYAELRDARAWLIQIGNALSPNPAAPLGFDPPIDVQGSVSSAALERWRLHCLFDPETVARFRSHLVSLSTIALVVPELRADDNAYQNRYWLELMAAAGIPVTRLDMPGGHGDHAADRLVALQRAILDGWQN